MSERISRKPALANRLKPVGAAGIIAGVLLTAACSTSDSRGGEVTHEQVVTTNPLTLSKSGSLAMQHFGISGDYTINGWERPFTTHVIVDCEPAVIPGAFEDNKISVFTHTNTLLGNRLMDSWALEDTVEGDCETYMANLDRSAVAERVAREDLTSINREISGDGRIVDNPRKEAQQLLEQASAGLCYDDRTCEGY